MEKKYKSENRDFFINYLPKEVFDKFSLEERSIYSKYRDRHRKFDKKLSELEVLQENLIQLQKRIDDKKLDIRNTQKDLFKFYDELKHFDNNIQFISWVEIEFRNKKEVQLNSKIDKKYRYSIVVEYRINGKPIRKKVSCGTDYGSIRNLILQIKNINFDSSKFNNDVLLKGIDNYIITPYVHYFIYMNGFKKFHDTPHNLKDIVEWCNSYDLKFGDKEWVKWGNSKYSNNMYKT